MPRAPSTWTRCVEAIDERVKLIAITHVPTNGGLVNPAAAIGRVAREHGIPFLLDACQSAGQMPLDVEELNVDILSATSRKFLRGPRGMGFLYVREALITALEPPFLDLHAATWTAPGEYRLLDDARRFENWECNVAAKIALGTAVNYALDWGLDAIEARVALISSALRQGLAALPGVRLRDRGSRHCGIVSYTVAEMAPAAVVQGLRERGINSSVSRARSTQLDMHGRWPGRAGARGRSLLQQRGRGGAFSGGAGRYADVIIGARLIGDRSIYWEVTCDPPINRSVPN